MYVYCDKFASESMYVGLNLFGHAYGSACMWHDVFVDVSTRPDLTVLT